MLTAISSQGTKIILPLLSKKKIVQLKEHTSFYCSYCKEGVILKVGSRRIPHFAHQRTSSCSRALGEGAYHEQGKVDLYRWLVQQGYSVQLEVFLSEINQRPDLLLQLGKKRIAIEFQCASIPLKLLISRTNGYHQLGITPLWFLGGNRMKRSKNAELRITPTEFHYMQQFSSSLPTSLFFYCPNQKQLSTFQHILYTGTRHSIGSLRFYSLSNMSFVALFKQQVNNDSTLYNKWLIKAKERRLRFDQYPNSKQKQWLEWLYLKRLNTGLLPSVCYLPVFSQWKLNLPPWNWQSRLCFDVMQTKQSFSLSDCQQLLHSYLHNMKEFPLIYTDHNPLMEYLSLLIQLEYIQENVKGRYQWVKKLQPHQSLEQAMKDDENVIRKLILLSSKAHEN